MRVLRLLSRRPRTTREENRGTDRFHNIASPAATVVCDPVAASWADGAASRNLFGPSGHRGSPAVASARADGPGPPLRTDAWRRGTCQTDPGFGLWQVPACRVDVRISNVHRHCLDALELLFREPDQKVSRLCSLRFSGTNKTRPPSIIWYSAARLYLHARAGSC